MTICSSLKYLTKEKEFLSKEELKNKTREKRFLHILRKRNELIRKLHSEQQGRIWRL